MKQTAVEWLVSEISRDRVGQAIIKTFLEEFEQAKKMEKQQIEDAFMVGVRNEKYRFDTKEQYYTETYETE